MKGVFITLEGIDGAGKSTQIELVRSALQQDGYDVRSTREPGGTVTGEAVREILLQSGASGAGSLETMTELLLVFAARAQHLREIVRPALARGQIVLCDRFTDATYAYQGGGGGIDAATIRALEDMVQGDLRPELTILLDVPVALGLSRTGRRGVFDRFDKETSAFFELVRAAYLDIAKKERERVRIVDASGPISEVGEVIVGILREALDVRHRRS